MIHHRSKHVKPSKLWPKMITPILINERVNVKPQECGSKDLNVLEKDGGQCADVSQTQHSGDPPDAGLTALKTKIAGNIDPDPSGAMSDSTESDEEMDMTVLSQPIADQPQIPPHLVLSFLYETYRQRNVIIIDHFPNLAPFIQTAKQVLKKLRIT